MEYTEKLFTGFLERIVEFDKECTSKINLTARIRNNRADEEERAYNLLRSQAQSKTKELCMKTESMAKDYRLQIQKVLTQDLANKDSTFKSLQKCKDILSIIESSERSIIDKDTYYSLGNSVSSNEEMSIDTILRGDFDFVEKALEINELLQNRKKKTDLSSCAAFYTVCRSSEAALKKHMNELNASIISNNESLHSQYSDIGNESISRHLDNWNSINNSLGEETKRFTEQRKKNTEETESVLRKSNDILTNNLNELIADFHKHYPPKELLEEYSRIYSLQPSYKNYVCCKEMPQSIQIGFLEYDISKLDLSNYTKSFLTRYYFFMYKGETLSIPFCASFGPEFNYLFRFKGDGRELVVKDARDLGMRLFMMLPPGKLNFTFIDPVTLGESFAMFTRLVHVNDNTNEIINGKIWSDPNDIEEKLRVMTDHIANVTQRCLQGKYDNIYEYNQDAEQNAEAYQVIMLMDFPTGLTEQSMKLLEQIATTGPKCGVFTILYRNESQFQKISERSFPLVSNIEKNFRVFDYSNSCKDITCTGVTFKNRPLQWKCITLPNQSLVDGIIEKLKTGIKNAEKIIVNFSKIIPPKDEWFKGDCSNELSIPIGVHGANNIQNLSFGLGGSHHALVAGQTGSGKSSLLHTIIMSALIKYPANQLQIFLVDFKRGVEFKIYANYSLENFKVIAIESEREFGCSVLEYLDKEQSRRADKFKKLNVDNVEDYRKKSGEILPRILIVIDEFQVLFSKDTSDIYSKNSSVYLEQIIRQGRAFGIHVILASQTMSSIGGINYGVWGQVGVRIALKCPKSDAKFVLGSDNDGVDLLSADNPGQAIYNSDCGNVVANTVFRVAYIEQDEQDKYLQYISENEPRFNYPATRVMLSNVEDNIYNPLQRFARGENFKFTENAILVGEPLKLINNMKMMFKQKQGSNMLVIGNDEQKARTLFTFAALSLSLHALTQNAYHKPTAPIIYLFDYAPLEVFEEKDDTLLVMSQKLPSYIRYIPFDETEDAMKDLYHVFKRREKAPEQNEELYMMVYGLQRARSLRSSDVYKKNVKFEEYDEFGEEAYRESRINSSREHINVKPYDMFMNLLQRGASFGINAIIWEDNFKLFMNSYADMLQNFDMRIAFTMPDDDSINFIEEVNGSKIGENGAIYNYNGNQKFRPYKKPDEEWLDKICSRIAQFGDR